MIILLANSQIQGILRKSSKKQDPNASYCYKPELPEISTDLI